MCEPTERIREAAYEWSNESLSHGHPLATNRSELDRAKEIFNEAADELDQDIMNLRRLLWLRHGCPIAALYGDDGEMSCGQCLIDFKRWNPVQIEQAFIGRNAPAPATTPVHRCPHSGPCPEPAGSCADCVSYPEDRLVPGYDIPDPYEEGDRS